jgi:hypothetical protein
MSWAPLKETPKESTTCTIQIKQEGGYVDLGSLVLIAGRCFDVADGNGNVFSDQTHTQSELWAEYLKGFTDVCYLHNPQELE